MKSILERMKKVVFCPDNVNPANAITAARVILTIFLNALIWSNKSTGHRLAIFVLTIIIWLGDIADGFVSRKLNKVTSFGGFLDKFADKFFACSVFAYFLRELWFQSNGIWLPFIKGLIIFSLIIELFLVIIWFYGAVKGKDLKTSDYSKVKESFYFITIAWWFLFNLIETNLEILFRISLILLFSASLIYGMLSIVDYVQRYPQKK